MTHLHLAKHQLHFQPRIEMQLITNHFHIDVAIRCKFMWPTSYPKAIKMIYSNENLCPAYKMLFMCFPGNSGENVQ